ncbi:FAD-dependent oxidoreductase [Variovorax sp. VNK109]|uniref:FAD-dependent oxidoreductase n=1 Tax=Variovorax sp. VNK109 TaxID=3400919 RepID=UPI003C0541B0
MTARECAIVGAGPAGLYCAQALLEADETLHVTVIEKLPAVFGLARYGVAPDHLKLKQICSVFEQILRHPRLHLVGNVSIPRTVSLDLLREHFHAVVLATGAPAPRRLGIPGEQLRGSHSATEVVAWYNGHPDAAHHLMDLSGEQAVVVGQGNVALDIARILLLSEDGRHRSDMAEHALVSLRASGVRVVHVAGRRDPWHTRFSVKELRELVKAAGIAVHVHTDPDFVDSEPPGDADDAQKAAGQFFQQVLRDSPSTAALDAAGVHFHFGLQPVAVSGPDSVESVSFRRGSPGSQEWMTLPARLLVRSIGSIAPAFAGLAIDETKGSIANRDGQIIDHLDRPCDGLFVTGWARRGAAGVIGTNRDDGAQVAARVLEFLGQQSHGTRGGFSALSQDLAQRGLQLVDQSGWARIDASERAAGRLRGRPRVKLVHVHDLLEASAGVTA